MSKIKISLLVILAILLGMVGWFAASFAEPFAAAQSVESPVEGLYTLTYRGDYGFDDFLQRSGASSADEMEVSYYQNATFEEPYEVSVRR